MNKVSIVLPTLNGERFIHESISSCLGQTYDDLELIIVDGGSTDGTLEIINGFNDDRILLLHQPLNSGRLPGALNLGFKKASGDFLTWTSDDNWYHPEAIQQMLEKLFFHQDVDFVYCDYWRIIQSSGKCKRFQVKPASELIYGNWVGHCFLYRRKVYEMIGDYDIDFFMAEDYEYWLRISKSCTMLEIPEPLYYYRVHGDSLTDSSGGFEAQQKSMERAKNKWIGPNPYIYPSREKRSLSELYLYRSFEAHREKLWFERRNCLIKALLNDPRHLFNRGVRSLVVRSIIKFFINTEISPPKNK